MKARKLLALGLTAIIGATMMAGCGGGGGSTTSQSSDGSSASGTYAFVAKDVQKLTAKKHMTVLKRQRNRSRTSLASCPVGYTGKAD